jgi:hypothetical protein
MDGFGLSDLFQVALLVYGQTSRKRNDRTGAYKKSAQKNEMNSRSFTIYSNLASETFLSK